MQQKVLTFSGAGAFQEIAALFTSGVSKELQDPEMLAQRRENKELMVKYIKLRSRVNFIDHSAQKSPQFKRYLKELGSEIKRMRRTLNRRPEDIEEYVT